jgi:hypothetical protein
MAIIKFWQDPLLGLKDKKYFECSLSVVPSIGAHGGLNKQYM